MSLLKMAWYRRPKAEVARGVIDVVDTIVQNDQDRLANYEKWVKMYGGRRQWSSPLRPGVGPKGRPAASSMPIPVDAAERLMAGNAPLRLNVTRAAIDTVTSKVGRMRPRPTFLTSGGDWTLKQRAKKLQRFMDGAYHESDAYEVAMEVFRDGMTLGTGVLLPYSRPGGDGVPPRICCERSPAWEWFVDPHDAEYGEPRCLYRMRWVARERVRLHWPELADAGREREGADEDYVCVCEAWFRPLDPPDEPELGESVTPSEVLRCGRHVILVDEEVALDEYYPYSDFPPVFFHWAKPVCGFWGDSAAREVEGIQVEINRLLDTIQKSMQKVGVPWVLLPNGANLKPREIANVVAQVCEYDGNVAPQVVTFQPIHPAVTDHLWRLYGKAFEILGSNQLAASATVPAGMESGRAVEALADEQSERFMIVSRAFEFAVGEQLARRFIRLAKEIDQATEGGYTLRAPGTRCSIVIAWKDVEIRSDGYIMQVFPTSALPTLPSARLDEVQRMQDSGWIDAEEARVLADFPDLQQSNSLATADYDNLMWQLEQMLEDGKACLPEPYQNLQRAVAHGQAAILRAQQDGAPEDNIALVRQFVDAAEEMLSAAMAAPTPGAPTGAPPDQMLPAAPTAPTAPQPQAGAPAGPAV